MLIQNMNFDSLYFLVLHTYSQTCVKLYILPPSHSTREDIDKEDGNVGRDDEANKLVHINPLGASRNAIRCYIS